MAIKDAIHSDDLTGLSASRKADRKRIAAEFTRIAERFGAEVEIREEPAHKGWSGPTIHFSARLDGVGVQCAIDDLHGGSGALLSWFNDYRGAQLARMFSDPFNIAVGSGIGARPHHKATSVGNWALLAARLQGGLRHTANGTAFLKETGK